LRAIVQMLRIARRAALGLWQFIVGRRTWTVEI